MEIKELNLKQVRDFNKDGWAVFIKKNGDMFVHRGGWPAKSGVLWTEVVHVLDPYKKTNTPRHSTFIMKKLGFDSDTNKPIVYREL